MTSSLHHSFAGRRVLVTGGASGLGRGIVKKFYDDGAQVYVLDRNSDLLDKLKKELPKVNTFCVDLLNWDETKRVVESLAPLDHLVNNAGIFGNGGHLIEATSEYFDCMFGVNVKAVLNVSQAFVKGIMDHKKAEGGTIVNISSIAAVTCPPGFGIYCATEAAATMLTRCMAQEFAQLNNHIRVNCIHPGHVPTALFSKMPTEFVEKVETLVGSRTILNHRANDPKDIANAVLFLSSPLAEMMTGTVMTVDQGFTAT